MTEENIKAWMAAKAKVAKYKKIEGNQRRVIAEEVLDGKTKGVKRQTIGNMIVVAKGNVNLSVDKDELKVMWNDLTPAEKEAIRFKPEVLAGKYNSLPGDSMLRRVVTAKPGVPSVEVKAIATE